MAARDSLTHILPSDRVLGYAEYGSPQGYPLFYLHGYPSSRLEAGVASEIAKRRNIRIISPDRPGFGLSDSQPGRKISDWPEDVRSLAKHLQLDRFAVLGGSGGGPYAIACANAFKKEQLSSVGVLAGGPHWGAERNLMSRPSHITAWMARRTPLLLKVLLASFIGSIKALLGLSAVRNYLAAALDKRVKAKAAAGKDTSMHPVGSHAQKMHQQMASPVSTSPKHLQSDASAPEQKYAAEPSLPVEGKDPMLAFQSLCDALLEPFRQGVQATIDDAVLLSDTDWGFDLKDIRYDKVMFWHGTEDSRAPIEMMRWMVKTIPHADIKEYENTGHFDMHPHLDEIMAALIPSKTLQLCLV